MAAKSEPELDRGSAGRGGRLHRELAGPSGAGALPVLGDRRGAVWVDVGEFSFVLVFLIFDIVKSAKAREKGSSRHCGRVVKARD